MYCTHCGQQINDEAVICPHCGCETGRKRIAYNDAKSTGFSVLGFFFPVIGLILYLVWKEDYPLKANSAGKGALIGVIVSVALYILVYVVVFGLIFGVLGNGMYY